MSRPRIGITTSYEQDYQMLHGAYVRAIEQAGGLPLIVPLLDTPAAAADFAALLDGLVITGGPGIVRGLIGSLPEDLPPVDPARDTTDTLIYGAMEGKPMLGICYGMQFINAQAGGTLYGDLTQQHNGAFEHSASRGGQNHPVRLIPDSRLAHIFQQPELVVNTYHRQAVVDIGMGLRVAATSPDGIVEAVESVDGRRIGVQWHPERMGDSSAALFEAFVAQCRAD